MSLSTTAGEVISAALAQLAILLVGAILILAVLTAIVTGLRALHHWRKSRQRHRADSQSAARRSIASEALLLDTPWLAPTRNPERPPKYRIGL